MAHPDPPESSISRVADEAQADLRDALGRLAIAFAACEKALSELVSAAVGAQDRAAARAFNAVMGFRQKLDLLAAVGLPRLSETPHSQRLADCIAVLHSFEQQRNTLLHSRYQLRLGPEDYFKFEAHIRFKERADRKKGLVQYGEDVEVPAVTQLAKRIAAYTYSYPQHSEMTSLYWVLVATFDHKKGAA